MNKLRLIDWLQICYDEDGESLRLRKIKEKLFQEKYRKAILVVDRRQDVEALQSHLTGWLRAVDVKTYLIVTTASNYRKVPQLADVTLVCCWFNREIMQQILLSNISQEYVLFLYETEKVWENILFDHWKQNYHDDNNEILKIAFDNEIEPFEERVAESSPDAPDPTDPESGRIYRPFPDLEKTLIQMGEGVAGTDKAVTAFKILVPGGKQLYVGEGQNVLCVSTGGGGGYRTETKPGSEITEGDMIVLRESDRSDIRSIADDIVNNAGYRKVSEVWRKALRKYAATVTFDQLFAKFKQYGFKKGEQTLQNWVWNDDMIAPKKREDLELIYKVTRDEELLKNLDLCWHASRKLRDAHIRAGFFLSEMLEYDLLKALGNDVRLVGNAISEIEIEIIGRVKICPVVQVCGTLVIPRSETLRLFD